MQKWTTLRWGGGISIHAHFYKDPHYFLFEGGQRERLHLRGDVGQDDAIFSHL